MLALFHMDVVAFTWFQWYTCINPTVTWQALKNALLIRFGPTDYETIDGTLAKLQQRTRLVQTYQTQFEHLANQVAGWSDRALMGHLCSEA